jgi:hypothetical protein
MDEKLPWYGGISNRQILKDTVRVLAIWLAFSVPVFALLWWLSSAFSVFGPLRPVVGALTVAAGFLGLGLIRFIKWRRNA